MKKLRVFLRYPPTVAALAVLTAATLAYLFWFAPGLPFVAAALALDIALCIAWFGIATNSKHFSAYVSRMPYESGAEDLESLVGGCSEGFRARALECASLVERIRKDFPGTDFEEDLGLFVSRLKELARENARILALSRSYGTREQQQRMAGIVRGQEAAILAQLESLRAFSGNLSLLEADRAGSGSDATEATESLKYINQGMEEMLKEAQDGK